VTRPAATAPPGGHFLARLGARATGAVRGAEPRRPARYEGAAGLAEPAAAESGTETDPGPSAGRGLSPRPAFDEPPAAGRRRSPAPAGPAAGVTATAAPPAAGATAAPGSADDPAGRADRPPPGAVAAAPGFPQKPLRARVPAAPPAGAAPAGAGAAVAVETRVSAAGGPPPGRLRLAAPAGEPGADGRRPSRAPAPAPAAAGPAAARPGLRPPGLRPHEAPALLSRAAERRAPAERAGPPPIRGTSGRIEIRAVPPPAPAPAAARAPAEPTVPLDRYLERRRGAR